MKKIEKVKIFPEQNIRQTIKVIDESGLQIALVVDEAQKLVGTVTDGDVRRALLSGVNLDSPVSLIMNKKPYSCRENESRDTILGFMKANGIHQMPLVDESGVIVGIETLSDLIVPQRKENAVVLMAGGLGARLRPLTEDCPKPMLKIGGRPILETILLNFIDHGFYKFYISLNYMSDVIVDYFGDGSKWGVEIKYIHEKEKLGTAGALGLIGDQLDKPLLVMNGDLLTNINFSQLLEQHMRQKSQGTMCVREYDFQVPYGVVNIRDHQIVSIDEKPIQKFFVNAGIYVLNSDILNMIPHGSYFDMTSLFEKMIEEREDAAVFPIREYWLDIGQMADFDRANGEFVRFFK